MQINTIKKNKDFNITYARGSSFASKNLVLICLKRKYGGVRYGFTVSKKVGCAVVRNKIRRRLKEAVRQEIPDITGNYFIILIARKGITDATYQAICKDIRYLLKRAKLIEATGL